MNKEIVDEITALIESMVHYEYVICSHYLILKNENVESVYYIDNNNCYTEKKIFQFIAETENEIWIKSEHGNEILNKSLIFIKKSLLPLPFYSNYRLDRSGFTCMSDSAPKYNCLIIPIEKL